MKKIYLIIFILGLGFTQDIDPPYYLDHPLLGPAIEILMPSEVQLENGLASFQVGFWGAEWVFGGEDDMEYVLDWLNAMGSDGLTFILDDGSGIQKYGFRMISPSGNVHEAFAQPGFDFNYTTTGDWGEYINYACCECGMDMGMCPSYDFGMTIPYNELEIGIYESSFLVVDYAGNELVISGDELELLGGSSTTTFINNDENLDNDPPYYHIHPDYGPSINIVFPNEVIINNSLASFTVGYYAADWMFENDMSSYFEFLGLEYAEMFDDGSGINKFGLRMISPSGVEYEAFIQPGDWEMNFDTYGNWSEYVNNEFCEFNFSGVLTCHEIMLAIPIDELELGTYESNLVVIDFVGNELVINGEELESLGGSSTTSFIDQNNNEDLDPPYYINHPEYGSNIQLYNMANEIFIENSVASIYMGFATATSNDFLYYIESLGLDPHTAFFDDGSGVNKFGLRMVSPSGSINEVFIQPGFNFNYTATGNWSEYVNWAWGNCEGFPNYCEGYDFGLTIPANVLELGTYEIAFIVVDFAGNELIIDGEELQSLGASSITTIINNENTSIIDVINDYALLTWDWGNGENIIITDNALDIFDLSDTLYIYDNNALISDDCNDAEIFGPALLDKYPFLNYSNSLSLYCLEGVDGCDEYDYRYPGYIKGNPMLFSFYDNSNNTFYDLIPEYSSGSGLFGIPFDDTLTFKYYNIENNMIYDINESIPFQPNMIIGDAINYYEFTFDENSGISGAPNWDFDYNYYEYNGSITSSIDGLNIGDVIVALVGDEVRGTISAMLSPFNTIIFSLMTYGNPSATTISSFEIGSESRINFTNNLNTYNTNRGGYKYNIYKDGNLLLENYTEQYYLDYDLNEEICYEIFLIDNYDNSEFLTTDELCFYFGENEESILGDVNGDLMINIVDVVMLVDIILNDNSDYLFADVNQDELINIVDVVMLVDIIINR